MKALIRSSQGVGGIFTPTLLSLLIVLFPMSAQALIVNSLRGFSDMEQGWSGGLGGSLGASGGNTEQTSLTTDARLQWRGQADVWRLLAKADRTSSYGLETARSVLGHLRHNHHIGGRWHTLAFLQLQENPFQKLESRFLAGYGARWEIHRAGALHVALGAADMYEREKIDGQQGIDSNHRLSMFMSTIFELREGVKIDALTFYQPLWSDMKDWRTFINISLDVKLTRSTSLFTGLNLERDSRPPTGVGRIDWSTSTGLRIGF